MHVKRLRQGLVSAAASVLLLATTPTVALANGGDIHIGGVSTGLPTVAAVGIAGVIALMLAMFVASWARYRREQAASGDGPPDEEPNGGDDRGGGDAGAA